MTDEQYKAYWSMEAGKLMGRALGLALVWSGFLLVWGMYGLHLFVVKPIITAIAGCR